MKKNCAICGKPSGMYPLCPACFKLRDEGKVIKCEKCEQWHYSDQQCTLQNEPDKITCVVCGIVSDKELCPNCKEKVIKIEAGIDKTQDISQLSDYYYNLKRNLFSYSSEYFFTALCKMIAISKITFEKFNYTALNNRVRDDINYYTKETKEYISTKEKETQAIDKIEEKKKRDEFDNKRIIRTDDGHKVLSDGEKNIDNALYANRVIHSYGQELPFYVSEKNKYCDFFIPVKSNSQGIYIEYWGIDDTIDYLNNKEEKTNAYKEEDVAFIGIEKEEPLKDTQGFTVRLIKQINEKAKKYFGQDKFIKY